MKIELGFRLEAHTDVFTLAEAVREQLVPVRDRVELTDRVADAVRDIDRADFAGTGRQFRPLAAALSKHDAEQREMRSKGKTQLRTYDPYSLELSVGRDPATGAVLGIAHCDQYELLQALWDLPGVARYPYWTTSEVPDGISETEWGERGTAWGRMLPTGVPADTMLTVIRLPRSLNSVRKLAPENLRQLGVELPSADRRARDLAEDVVVREALALGKDPLNVALYWMGARHKEPVYAAAHAMLAPLTLADLFAEEEVVGPTPIRDVLLDAAREWARTAYPDVAS